MYCTRFRIERSDPGLSTARRHFVVFLGKRPYSHSGSLHTGWGGGGGGGAGGAAECCDGWGQSTCDKNIILPIMTLLPTNDLFQPLNLITV